MKVNAASTVFQVKDVSKALAFYLEVLGFSACALLKERGVTIESAPADQEYGMRDFVMRDPDGNVLTFGCPPSPA